MLDRTNKEVRPPGFVRRHGIAILLIVVSLIIVAINLARDRHFNASSDDPVNVARVAWSSTKLHWPADAKVVDVIDSHKGLHYDGAVAALLSVSHEELMALIDGPAPWGQRSWMPGPVPNDIASKCFVALGSSNHSGEPSVPMDMSVVYCAVDFQRANIPWHNGGILIASKSANKVYLCLWDY